MYPSRCVFPSMPQFQCGGTLPGAPFPKNIPQKSRVSIHPCYKIHARQNILEFFLPAGKTPQACRAASQGAVGLKAPSEKDLRWAEDRNGGKRSGNGGSSGRRPGNERREMHLKLAVYAVGSTANLVGNFRWRMEEYSGFPHFPHVPPGRGGERRGL